jgi:hypothetical protein
MWSTVAILAVVVVPVVVLALRAIGSERAAGEARVALADQKMRTEAATATGEAQRLRGDELEQQLAAATLAIGERDARLQRLAESLGRAGAGGAGAVFDELLPAAAGPGGRDANDRPAVPGSAGGGGSAPDAHPVPGRGGGGR